jgi:flagellin-like protein
MANYVIQSTDNPIKSVALKEVNIMMYFKQNEEAVSPVIGVILMVAITVILAAVIAAFVFGMGSNVQTQKTVGVNLQKDNTDLKVTIAGGPDLPALQYLRVTVDNTAYCTQEGAGTYAMTKTSSGGTRSFKVGETFTLGGKLSPSGYKRVVVVGHFSDGQDQMLADKQI